MIKHIVLFVEWICKPKTRKRYHSIDERSNLNLTNKHY